MTDSSVKRCVAGFVKARSNNDGSTRFTVAGKDGVRFVLPDKDRHAEALRQAHRALVCYEEGGKSPKVTLVLKDPSPRLIREHQEMCKQ